MAFEMNDLKRILFLMLLKIISTTSTNIDCNGKAFHCVDSTHFMICVDLGGGVSMTIDDFIIPCPQDTVCEVNNRFECEYPTTTTQYPLNVIGVTKPQTRYKTQTRLDGITIHTLPEYVSSENTTYVNLQSIPQEMTTLPNAQRFDSGTPQKNVNIDSTSEITTVTYNAPNTIYDTDEIFADVRIKSNTHESMSSPKREVFNVQSIVETSSETGFAQSIPPTGIIASVNVTEVPNDQSDLLKPAENLIAFDSRMENVGNQSRITVKNDITNPLETYNTSIVGIFDVHETNIKYQNSTKTPDYFQNITVTTLSTGVINSPNVTEISNGQSSLSTPAESLITFESNMETVGYQSSSTVKNVIMSPLATNNTSITEILDVNGTNSSSLSGIIDSANVTETTTDQSPFSTPAESLINFVSNMETVGYQSSSTVKNVIMSPLATNNTSLTEILDVNGTNSSSLSGIIDSASVIETSTDQAPLSTPAESLINFESNMETVGNQSSFTVKNVIMSPLASNNTSITEIVDVNGTKSSSSSGIIDSGNVTETPTDQSPLSTPAESLNTFNSHMESVINQSLLLGNNNTINTMEIYDTSIIDANETNDGINDVMTTNNTTITEILDVNETNSTSSPEVIDLVNVTEIPNEQSFLSTSTEKLIGLDSNIEIVENQSLFTVNNLIINQLETNNSSVTQNLDVNETKIQNQKISKKPDMFQDITESTLSSGDIDSVNLTEIPSDRSPVLTPDENLIAVNSNMGSIQIQSRLPDENVIINSLAMNNTSTNTLDGNETKIQNQSSSTKRDLLITATETPITDHVLLIESNDQVKTETRETKFIQDTYDHNATKELINHTDHTTYSIGNYLTTTKPVSEISIEKWPFLNSGEKGINLDINNTKERSINNYEQDVIPTIIDVLSSPLKITNFTEDYYLPNKTKIVNQDSDTTLESYSTSILYHDEVDTSSTDATDMQDVYKNKSVLLNSANNSDPNNLRTELIEQNTGSFQLNVTQPKSEEYNESLALTKDYSNLSFNNKQSLTINDANVTTTSTEIPIVVPLTINSSDPNGSEIIDLNTKEPTYESTTVSSIYEYITNNIQMKSNTDVILGSTGEVPTATTESVFTDPDSSNYIIIPKPKKRELNETLVTRNITYSSNFNCSAHSLGRFANNKECRKFYTCIGGPQPVVGTCPPDTVFSDTNKQCTNNLSHCVRNNQFRCLLEGRYNDLSKDNIYYICVKNNMTVFTRYTLQCLHGYHLNKKAIKCERNLENIPIGSASPVSDIAQK